MRCGVQSAFPDYKDKVLSSKKVEVNMEQFAKMVFVFIYTVDDVALFSRIFSVDFP